MKLISLMALFLLAFSAIPLVHVSPRAEASAPTVMALDVCNTSGSTVHTSVDFPFMCESTVKPFPERFAVLHEVAELPLKSSLPTFQGEHPPES